LSYRRRHNRSRLPSHGRRNLWIIDRPDTNRELGFRGVVADDAPVSDRRASRPSVLEMPIMYRTLCLVIALGSLAAAPGCSSCMGSANSCRRPSFMEFRSPCSGGGSPCAAPQPACQPACQPAWTSSMSVSLQPQSFTSWARPASTRGPSDFTHCCPSWSATIAAGRASSISCDPGGR